MRKLVFACRSFYSLFAYEIVLKHIIELLFIINVIYMCVWKVPFAFREHYMKYGQISDKCLTFIMWAVVAISWKIQIQVVARKRITMSRRYVHSTTIISTLYTYIDIKYRNVLHHRNAASHWNNLVWFLYTRRYIAIRSLVVIRARSHHMCVYKLWTFHIVCYHICVL